MPRRITFNKKRETVANETILMRHAKRFHIRNPAAHHLVGLTLEGKKESFEIGRAMKKDKILKVYYSTSKRTKQTAFHIRRGHKSVGGSVAPYKRAKATGVRKELLGKPLFMDGPYSDVEFAKVGRNNNLMIRKWLDGAFDPTKIRSPKEITKDMHRRLALGRRAANRGIMGYRILNVSHDWQILAKLEHLLGVKFETHGFNSPVPNEAIIIYHTKSGKDILDYQGKRIDITKALANKP